VYIKVLNTIATATCIVLYMIYVDNVYRREIACTFERTLA